VFYAANHHSWIDIPVISGVTGCTFVANDGIEKWPLIGWLCTINNTIFVSRENRLSVGDQVDELREAMSGEQPVTIFPEGTTHDGSGLLPFKPSLFAALVPAAAGDDGAAGFPDLRRAYPAPFLGGRRGHSREFLADHDLCEARHRDAPFPRTVRPRPFPDRKAISAEVRHRISEAMQAGDRYPRDV
jgi:1-acyl-sn-glycerol-3-phosphate acyltransferase